MSEDIKPGERVYGQTRRGTVRRGRIVRMDENGWITVERLTISGERDYRSEPTTMPPDEFNRQWARVGRA